MSSFFDYFLPPCCDFCASIFVLLSVLLSVLVPLPAVRSPGSLNPRSPPCALVFLCLPWLSASWVYPVTFPSPCRAAAAYQGIGSANVELRSWGILRGSSCAGSACKSPQLQRCHCSPASIRAALPSNGWLHTARSCTLCSPGTSLLPTAPRSAATATYNDATQSC